MAAKKPNPKAAQKQTKKSPAENPAEKKPDAGNLDKNAPAPNKKPSPSVGASPQNLDDFLSEQAGKLWVGIKSVTFDGVVAASQRLDYEDALVGLIASTSWLDFSSWPSERQISDKTVTFYRLAVDALGAGVNGNEKLAERWLDARRAWVWDLPDRSDIRLMVLTPKLWKSNVVACFGDGLHIRLDNPTVVKDLQTVLYRWGGKRLLEQEAQAQAKAAAAPAASGAPKEVGTRIVDYFLCLDNDEWKCYGKPLQFKKPGDRKCLDMLTAKPNQWTTQKQHKTSKLADGTIKGGISRLRVLLWDALKNTPKYKGMGDADGRGVIRKTILQNRRGCACFRLCVEAHESGFRVTLPPVTDGNRKSVK